MKPDARPAMRAMIDASSAILLTRSGAIERCCRAYCLQMTRTVFEEVTVPHRQGARYLQSLAGRRPGIAVLADPASRPDGQAAVDLRGLHRGERDSLQHVLNGAARFVIIDDGPGVRACRRQSIPHVNALLCPKLLLFSGKIARRRADLLFARIAVLGRYSEDVRHWAATCRPSDLNAFMDG